MLISLPALRVVIVKLFLVNDSNRTLFRYKLK